MLKIIKCNDPMRWYADKIGELVPYLGDFMGEYKSREDSGCTNFVQHGDAEVIVKEQDNEKLEQLEKRVADTKAACNAADAAYDAAYYAYGAAYDAWDAYAADAAYDAFSVADAAWDAAYDAWDKAKDELAEYLKEQDND
tara:strand:- start:2312 stop:2731 length:420 start_codon:yes stop_codon:yes gene_type:complete